MNLVYAPVHDGGIKSVRISCSQATQLYSAELSSGPGSKSTVRGAIPSQGEAEARLMDLERGTGSEYIGL